MEALRPGLFVSAPGMSGECMVTLENTPKRHNMVVCTCRAVGQLVAQMRSAAMSAIWSLSEEERTSRGHRVFVDAEVIRGRPLQEVGWHGKLGEPPQGFRAVAVSSTSSPHEIRGR
jgi:hypothetical protein